MTGSFPGGSVRDGGGADLTRFAKYCLRTEDESRFVQEFGLSPSEDGEKHRGVDDLLLVWVFQIQLGQAPSTPDVIRKVIETHLGGFSAQKQGH